MERIADQRFRHTSLEDIAGSGHVVEGVEAALWCFQPTDSFREAILGEPIWAMMQTPQRPFAGSWPEPTMVHGHVKQGS